MFWKIYFYIAQLAIFTQVYFITLTMRNFRYAMKKARRKLENTQCTLLTVPCKGIDNEFDRNISSFFNIDYDNFYLHFVVEDTDDPAYEALLKLKEKLTSVSKARDIKILISGKATGCSQKIHNLLYSCSSAPQHIEVFAFADSDACIRPDWLNHLVYPLRRSRYGATTGYRWFIPQRNNLASLALSAVNAKVAQLLGNTPFNLAWGGSMAIRKKTFYDIGLDKIWQKAISDDLCLSRAVKKAKKKIVYTPACLVASYENTTWAGLFEFVRRQFIITRITLPGSWFFAVFSNLYSLSGLWLAGILALLAAFWQLEHLSLYAAVPIIFFVGQITRAVLRQIMVTKLLPEEAKKLHPAMTADILGTFFWSWLVLIFLISSAIGRTITWRGIRYRLLSPTETEIISE